MKEENKEIDDKIQSYEALMHRVLRNYNVKEDYEDLLQEMRIVVWKALTDKSQYKYSEEKNTKFTTYLYNLMKNRLINIFKIEYKRRPEKIKKSDEDIAENDEVFELTLKNKIKRNVANPKLLEDLSFKQQINALHNMHDANSIRLKTDIETFYNTLDDFEQLLWTLNLEGGTQKEISKKLKKININKDRTTISKKLKTINNKFLNFIKNGEL